MTNPAWRRRLVAGTRVVGPVCNSVLADWGYEPVKIRIFNNLNQAPKKRMLGRSMTINTVFMRIL